jgi:hypothetical protein
MTLNKMKKPNSPYSHLGRNNMRHELYDILKSRFNIEEINALCFDLNIDHENLLGTTKEVKARELVSLMERRNALVMLSEIIQKIRPDISPQLDELLQKTGINSLSHDVNSADEDVVAPLPAMGVVETVISPLRLTLEGELGTGKWELFVTNEGDTEVRRVNVVMRPSSAVIVSPNKVLLGTVFAGQTKQASNALVIRPNRASHDKRCVLPFEVIYAEPGTKPNRYKSEFQIPITGN